MTRLILPLLVLVWCCGCAAKESDRIRWYYKTLDDPDKRQITGIQAHASPELWVGIFKEGDTIPSVTLYYDPKTKSYRKSERDGRIFIAVGDAK